MALIVDQTNLKCEWKF